jgi:AraC-like DNA-binding protein
VNDRLRALSDPAALARSLHARPGVGVAAHVLQGRGLEILRVHVQQPALILVDRGIKTVKPERGPGASARPGQAIVLAGDQTVDFTNAVPDGTHYEARWLVFDPALLDDGHYASRAAQLAPPGKAQAAARVLARVPDSLAEAFQRATHALAPEPALPDAVARQRVLEAMHWLLEEGIALRSPPPGPGVAVKVRALLAGRLDLDWSANRVAGELAMSEPTLRRRLAAEGTSLTELLVDARMATALTLLQATSQPVSEIAFSVGYESPSRFAVRFRQRFGFAPTAVRGHERAV